eukprot:536192-Prorocentrum_minimum.AAC.1
MILEPMHTILSLPPASQVHCYKHRCVRTFSVTTRMAAVPGGARAANLRNFSATAARSCGAPRHMVCKGSVKGLMGKGPA